jgi:hypothetical protein
MLFSALAVSSLFVAVAVATPEPAPYRIGSMSVNPAFGLAKRQAGYQPTQTFCGSGYTCAEACGADYVQCPSSDGNLHCYDPAIQDTCCPDGTGSKHCYLLSSSLTLILISCVNRLLCRGILLHPRRLWRDMVLPQCTSLLAPSSPFTTLLTRTGNVSRCLRCSI